MFKVIKKEKIALDTYSLKIQAPKIASATKPGQFLMIQLDDNSERIPLTIADNTKTTVTVIFLTLGYSTKKLAGLRKSSFIKNVVGPLGNPSEMDEYGEVLVIGGGLGLASCFPIIKGLNLAGNSVTTIMGAKSKNHLFWTDEFAKISDKVFISTDDGSLGIKGQVTDILRKILRKAYFNRVYAIGPGPMMKAVSEVTKSRVKTIVSLNPIMIDGMGMCGSCRVTVDDEVKFGCIDGPEFDAHLVNWKEFLLRLNQYDKQERHICRIRK